VKPLIDDERLPESPASLEADPELAPVETVASNEVEDVRKKFIGEVDLPESACPILSLPMVSLISL
jgi:hypothetical protein